MKLTFENLGALDVGELELADLTVICGENNTGKTYVTYLVYCLLTSWRHMVDINLKRVLVDLSRAGVAKVDLEKAIATPWADICAKTVKVFEINFPEMLASNSDLFSRLKLTVDFPLGNSWKSRDYTDKLGSAKGNLLLTLSKPVGSAELELAAPQTDKSTPRASYALEHFIKERLWNLMLEGVIPDVFIASTERTGATTFKKQMNLARNNLIDLLSQVHKNGADNITPKKIFETMYGKPEYAEPVRENVRFLNQLPSVDAEDGAFFKAHPELLTRFESIVGGTYATNKEGVTWFQPRGSNLKLGLGEVSSSVRSLLIVWYWLKYFAKSGNMLMIDEPELNLHPANQRRLARFIVALVNNGIKVFITTHSDYIVKEFNTLIMLNQDSKKLQEIRKKLNDYNPEDRLDSKRVALYMTLDQNTHGPEDGNKKKTVKTLVRADVSSTLGIEARSFDETIEDMNSVQEKIYYGLN